MGWWQVDHARSDATRPVGVQVLDSRLVDTFFEAVVRVLNKMELIAMALLPQR